MPASPCIQLCQLSPDTGLCAGCFRTLDEIAAWRQASDAEQHAILHRVQARRQRALQDRLSPVCHDE